MCANTPRLRSCLRNYKVIIRGPERWLSNETTCYSSRRPEFGSRHPWMPVIPTLEEAGPSFGLPGYLHTHTHTIRLDVVGVRAPLILALGDLRQVDPCEFDASLIYLVIRNDD